MIRQKRFSLDLLILIQDGITRNWCRRIWTTARLKPFRMKRETGRLPVKQDYFSLDNGKIIMYYESIEKSEEVR